MNAGQMVNAVYRRSGYPTDDPLVTPEVVLDAVNEALRLIAAERDWPWLQASTTFSTTAGDATYALPSSYMRTRRIVDPDTEPLERYDARQLEELYGEDGGEPVAFAIDGEEIILRPIPNGARTYTHYYVRTERTLTADTEDPYLPSQFHDAAVALAESLVHDVGRDPKRAEAARDRYEKLWRPRMLDDARRARGTLRPRIRPGSAF